MTKFNDTPENLLSLYSLERGDEAFTHQHVVDAATAQNATRETSPMALTFALVGLYLLVELHFTGRRGQQAHTLLARRRPAWPEWILPESRGDITAADLLKEPPGEVRDLAIKAWCSSVWNAYIDSHEAVIAFAERNLFL